MLRFSVSSKFRAGVLVAGTLLLGACSTSGSDFREIVGLDNRPPDEFLVVTKAPLVMPPDIALRAPAPGAPQLNQASTRDAAQLSTFGETTKVAGTRSSGEAAILSRTGTGDGSVRQAMRLENQGIIQTDEGLADRILRVRREKTEILDADEEARRLRLLKRSKRGRLTASDILLSGSSTATN
ncbi:MAG: DUF3035 domain-containing protein [Alphaproteobacteria bacterium]